MYIHIIFYINIKKNCGLMGRYVREKKSKIKFYYNFSNIKNSFLFFILLVFKCFICFLDVIIKYIYFLNII